MKHRHLHTFSIGSAGVLLFLLIGGTCESSLAEIIVPGERVHWGDTIHVVVKPNPERGLYPGDRAWLTVGFWRQGVEFIRYEPLQSEGGQFSCDLTLPDDWEYANASVVTTERWIPGGKGLAALDRNGEIPPGAPVLETSFIWNGSSRRADWEAVAKAELSRYPTLWWLYPEVWGLHFMASGGKVPVELIRDQLPFLEQADESAVLLRVLMQANWELGETTEALRQLERLCEHYPDSRDTIRALNKAGYEIFKRGLLPVSNERWKALAAQAVNGAPGNPALRVYDIGLYSNEGITLASFRRLFEAWTKDDGESPYPYILLARALAREETELDRAEKLLTRGLELSFAVRPVLLYAGYPGLAFRLRSDLRARRGDAAGALADIRAAQALARKGDPTDIETEAEIWLQAGRPVKAETVALEAYRKGSLEAEAFVKDLYATRTGRSNGAEEYFWSRLTEGADRPGDPSDEPEDAPHFEGVTLEGRRVDNTSLKGKVVVLNFWFTTCGPCIGEMKELNELVRDFGDRVRFLAFTHEPPEMVRTFLESHEFDYEIVPNAREIEESFGIGSHPTHVLIDQKGKVRWQGLGANPDNLKRLRATIQRVLTIGDTHVVGP